MNNNSMRTGTILITGISASGKSTLGKRLHQDLVANGIHNVKCLDGEDLRKQLAEQGKYYDHSIQARSELSVKFAQIALEYNRKGINCILCSIYHVRQWRQQIRKMMDNFMEVYLNCSVNVCAQRDYKGHYKKAFAGEYSDFIGVTEPYEESNDVELTLDTSISSIEECSEALIEASLDFIQSCNNKRQNKLLQAETNY